MRAVVVNIRDEYISLFNDEFALFEHLEELYMDMSMEQCGNINMTRPRKLKWMGREAVYDGDIVKIFISATPSKKYFYGKEYKFEVPKIGG